jgi:hypothetical protein
MSAIPLSDLSPGFYWGRLCNRHGIFSHNLHLLHVTGEKFMLRVADVATGAPLNGHEFVVTGKAEPGDDAKQVDPSWKVFLPRGASSSDLPAGVTLCSSD